MNNLQLSNNDQLIIQAGELAMRLDANYTKGYLSALEVVKDLLNGTPVNLKECKDKDILNTLKRVEILAKKSVVSTKPSKRKVSPSPRKK